MSLTALSPSTNESQRRAADPASNVWVTANAGSGKTHVLVNRLIWLMLEGADPARILCLTFTRAAAAEMSRRLFAKLASWIALDDAALSTEVCALTGAAQADAIVLERARQLFARALDTPGGLKIETIHAFCERLLQRFPVEAGVVPGFEVLDEREAVALLARLKARVLAEAVTGPEAEALARIIGLVSHDQLSAVLGECLGARKAIARLTPGAPLWQALSEAIGLDADDSPAQEAARLREALGDGMLASAISALHSGSTNDRKAAARLEALRAACAHADDESLLDAAEAAFLTKAHELHARPITTGTAAKFPQVFDWFIRTAEATLARHAKRQSFLLRAASAALLTLARRVVTLYDSEKRRLGCYDYDDLILRSLELLTDSASAQWVLYKLDSRLEHILVDEAQDTSPAQWDVIAALTEEFFAGLGAHEQGPTRTLFVVGDDKQSIYSFQGADPARFAAMHETFKARIAAAGARFERVALGVSFRSTAAILDAVDAVLARTEMRAAHAATRNEVPGRVEIWPLEEADPAAERDPWTPPADEGRASHARLILARRIARRIRDWIDSGEALTSRGRPLRCDDILILLRQRTTLMDMIVRALKQEGLPVAGADRLKLTDSLAVQDLLALIRLMLRPEDDLSCAALLKSPLLARDDGTPMDDSDLIALAPTRGAASLWQTLAARGSPYTHASLRLARWQQEAAVLSPFDFLSRVLGRDHGLAALIGRLGSEAAEPVDAFLAEALTFGRENTPSLQGFLAWLTTSSLELKRDMDQGSGEIRVMTAHGAKGLEANVVILPDTCDPGTRRNSIFLTPTGLPLWHVKGTEKAPVAMQLEQIASAKAMEEYDRLLYVAMTRACDRLYVAGTVPRGGDAKPGTWYERIRSALADRLTPFTYADGFTVSRFDGEGSAVTPDKDAAEAPRVSPLPAPGWAQEPAPSEPAATNWRAPSHVGRQAEATATETVWPADPATARRYRRGNLIHSLLQYLPDLAPDRRATAARDWLTTILPAGADNEVADITHEIMSLLTMPGFAAIFGPGSQAEVPLAALLGEEGLTGRIDRLLIGADEILALDYKTNRPPPDRLEAVPAAYIAQMAAYRAALGLIFPGRTIRTALIWTHGARFMEIPGP